MYKFILLSTLFTIVLAGGKNKCPWALGKYPFDEQRFAGEWKAHSGTQVMNKVPNCGTFDYKVTKDGHNIFYTGKTEEGKEVKGEAFAQPIFGKPDKSASLMAVWKKDGGEYSGVFKQAIVATDYDNYALMLSCKPSFDEATKTFTRELKAGILYRPGKTLSADTIAVLTNLLTSYDIDPSEIKLVDQTNC